MLCLSKETAPVRVTDFGAETSLSQMSGAVGSRSLCFESEAVLLHVTKSSLPTRFEMTKAKYTTRSSSYSFPKCRQGNPNPKQKKTGISKLYTSCTSCMEICVNCENVSCSSMGSIQRAPCASHGTAVALASGACAYSLSTCATAVLAQGCSRGGPPRTYYWATHSLELHDSRCTTCSLCLPWNCC